MIPNVGPMEILIVVVVALVVFGPKRLPELGSSLGKGVRGFGRAIKGEDDEPAALAAGESAESLKGREQQRSESA